jgi:8-oxo-dGTP pyrophosphatase MutT (NUDIX family)
MNPSSNACPVQDVVSCGTLIINAKGEILLCHVTGQPQYDIPKGCMDPGEDALTAALRELWEETGLEFDGSNFEDLGNCYYKTNKWLHLFKVRAPADLVTLDHLTCRSHFRCSATGEMRPEMDGYRWASRAEIPQLCTKLMANKLLSLDW